MSAGRSPTPDEGTPLPPAFEGYTGESLAQAPAGGPGKNGLLEATFARRGDGPTRLIRDRVKVPYHLTGTLETDPAPGLTTLVAQEPTGGVAQGDRHRLRVETREGARAHVTTQSATKVHSMDANYAHLDASFRAQSGSYLEYLPGPTIVNEDARCLQTIDVDLADDACVVVADVLVPDGLTDHEPFGFDHYHARVEAEHDGRLVCADAVDLRPSEREPRDPASVGEYGVVGSLYVFAPASSEESDLLESLIEGIHERLSDRDDVEAGVSTLPHEVGAIVRILGDREADVTETLRAAWDETRRRLLGVGAPADRRY
ncbi:Urease accessory protein UreD [Haloterrigena turkmenica DSM 5511]|uniref:Urease accessory protein UreD n=1 Tax=Haloterrigena turkmenica (strain ATCC 51198 / DSM 5511 / JCM 9101 / NCIMB 13204 / VKM B-1734 / 4k) TaxID=543526 RepID=D2RQW0_HALTV|nr:urease accessory protein UreD [Haloterrigena turkmenica]ADB60441.1 Urease accessory protein UreD [Haloterrigena turkmenica DSM 5511]